MTPDTTTRKNDVLERFDQILFKHLERLIGSRYGIGGLPMNSATISCLILLMERENEIESFPSASSVRYTAETLISELRELGFSPDVDMNIVIQEMIEKGYIQVDHDDLIAPEKPAISMAKLLDRTFPGMPGMNLVGYFIQTMDEVKSKRKDLDSAISQYDQTLEMQGVLLIKSGVGTEASKERKSQTEKPNILRQQKDDPRRNAIRVSPSEPKILSSAAFKGKVKKIDFGKAFTEEEEADEITPHPDENIEDETPETSVAPEKTESYETEPERFDTELAPSSKQLKSANFDVQRPSVSATITKEPEETTEQDPEAGDVKKESPYVDDEISHRISAFENDLAMECPICKHYRLQVEKTATGKPYYKCSNKHCNFISWGKPYHILCPQCNNPFLVETIRAEKTILKCPRATCRYWKYPSPNLTDNFQENIDAESEKMNKVTSISRKPRKRVVRRRVVRKKSKT